MKNKKKTPSKIKKKKKGTRKTFEIVIFSIAIILLIIFLFNAYTAKEVKVDLDIDHVNITLSSSPVKKESRYKGSTRTTPYYELKAEEYPLKRFVISTYSYKSCNSEITTELSKNDEIQIGILKKDVKNKLNQFSHSDNNDINNKWNRIEIYDLAFFENKTAKLYLHEENVETKLGEHKKGYLALLYILPIAIIIPLFMWYYFK